MEPILNKKYIKNAVKKAKKILHNGGLVIFPTETVLGLGADATNSKAIKEIYNLKKRPKNNPLICHFKNLRDVNILSTSSLLHEIISLKVKLSRMFFKFIKFYYFFNYFFIRISWLPV